MKKIFLLASIALISCGQAQTPAKASAAAKGKNTKVVIGFWNVENLYDTINDPKIDDEEFLPSAKSKWNSERYAKKQLNISTIISNMGVDENKDGLAILGLAEIENKAVLEDLVKTPALKSRKYGIVHHNSPDHRGIDVAMLYNPKYFKLISSSVHTVKLPGDSARPTRDELLVNGKLNGELVHILVCHWPSRRGGDAESNPLRVAAATVAKGIVDSIRKAEKNPRIIIMGDLNDDPTNESVKAVINTSGDAAGTNAATMYDPMEKILADGQGTLSFKGKWNLFDQIIMTEAFTKQGKNNLTFKYAKVNNVPEVCETNEKYKGQPLRTYVGAKYLGGYSDHFGVYAVFGK
ncbi:MAG TPA: endonuclease/exonuclease/phosphatase family protein [Bacteroidia bacterium]